MLDSFARRMVSDRLFLLTVAAGIAMIALSLLGLLYIQAIMIAWSIMMFYFIIRIERKKADVGQTLGISDFAWYSLNEELQAIDRELKNAKDENKAKKLIARRREIERKLREARWGIREDELSSLYSSSKPALCILVKNTKKVHHDDRQVLTFLFIRLDKAYIHTPVLDMPNDP